MMTTMEQQLDDTTSVVVRKCLNYNELPISSKVLLIRDYETLSYSQRSLASKYTVSRATVNQIIKQKHRYLSEFAKMRGNNNCMTLKRFRKTSVTSVNHVLEQYVTASKNSKTVLTGPKLKAKAREIAHQMGINDFKASNGWLDSFKKRCSLEFSSSKKLSNDSIITASPNFCNIQTEYNNNNNFNNNTTDTNTNDFNNNNNSNSNTLRETVVDCHMSNIVVDDQLTADPFASLSQTAWDTITFEHDVVDNDDDDPLTINNTASSPVTVTRSMDRDHDVNHINSQQQQQQQPPDPTPTPQTPDPSAAEISLSQIEVPAIADVRSAIDTLERFTLTKMPSLLSSILSIRQEVANFVIQQQIQLQQQHSVNQMQIS